MGIFDFIMGRKNRPISEPTSTLSEVVEVPTATPSPFSAAPTVSAAASQMTQWASTFAPSQTFLDIPQLPHSANQIVVPDGYEVIKSSELGSGRVEFPADGTSAETPHGLYWDPFSLVEQLGYRERPSSVSYATIDAMIWRMPIIHAIIQTRLNQISAFCTPTNHRFEYGFRIRMRDIEDQPTAADKKYMKKLTNMLLFSGNGVDPRSHDNFETFVRKIMRDSLGYDALCYEIIPDRAGKPAAWYALDAKTIRYANSSKLYPDTSLDSIYAVQIYDNVTIAEYTREELAFDIRNPRTDIRAYNYGVGEVEMLVSTVTALLFAWEYNVNAFSQGSLQKGLLNLVGSIPEKQLRAFRRQWYNMVAGAENAWRTPILNTERVEWVNMQNSSKDMEFSAFLDFMIKVACAIFQIDPIELNFKYGQSGQGKAMFEGANKSKITESKDRGLKPLLRFLSRSIDKHIIWPINPNFSLEFVGLDAQTPKELADLMTQRVRTMYTIDELRAENDMPALPNGLGQVILDANWMNAKKEWQAKKDAEDAKKEAEAQQEAQIAALASEPDSKVSSEELGQLSSLLTQPPTPGPTVSTGGGGPGGGRKAPMAPDAGSVAAKSLNSRLVKSEPVLIEIEV